MDDYGSMLGSGGGGGGGGGGGSPKATSSASSSTSGNNFGGFATADGGPSPLVIFGMAGIAFLVLVVLAFIARK